MSNPGPSKPGPSKPGPSKPGPSRGPSTPSPKKESLKEVKTRKRKEMDTSPKAGTSGAAGTGSNLVDPYCNAIASNYITRGKTGVVYDGECLKHRCEWDSRYPENPTRLTTVMDKCYDTGFLNRCYNVPNYLRTDLYEKVLYVHSKEHYEKLKDISTWDNIPAMENEAANYDSVYFNRYTFDSACRALSSVLNLVEAVAKRDVQNGIALVRPPGHHAMESEYNGYCFFNNVAIAAETCIREKHSARIMIVDIDVHHGQGIQQKFYDRKDVLYFSIHRYEYGNFWPNLIESNFNFIGKGEGLGYNVNVPLNTTGLTDEDYLAIIMHILLPIGYEFNPDLIIVAGGYDAAIGCPEGRMNVTPGFYSHLITLLSGLARGQIAVCLEGGYFPPTLAEGTAMTLKALLGGPCPILGSLRSVHPLVIDTICNVRRALFKYWKCFSICEVIPPSEMGTAGDVHQYKICYYGKQEKGPYQTRRCYPENSIVDALHYEKLNVALMEKYKAPMDLPVYYVYDEKMLLHAPKRGDVERPEKAERLHTIMKTFEEFGVDKRCIRAPIIRRDFTPYQPHEADYFRAVSVTYPQSKDLYVNDHTREAVLLAVSGVMILVDLVMERKASSGVAIIRPPGHHAEHNRAMGFCFANNIAIGANYLLVKYALTRILIIDFDIHHGNGTQHTFYESGNVMYISIHRDDDGKFFPTGVPKSYINDGYGAGKGLNMNIPFSKDKMGDTEYLSVFHNIILPAAYAFNPQIVLVSAGFDAGINDPLGGYQLSPEIFGHFIQMLKPLAEGRLILTLEGGYNLTTTSYAMTICTKVLLGDPVIMPKNLFQTFSPEAIKTIRKVIEHFKQYYNVFQVHRKLSLTPYLCKKLRKFFANSHGAVLYKALDVDRAEDSDYVMAEMRCFNVARD